MSSLYAVIMAGGSGKRFWPLSRRCNPKQLLKFSNASSMLQLTVTRLQPLIPYEKVIIITTKEQVEKVKKQLPQIPEENILVEEVGRNTAAAIAFAAFFLKNKDPQAVMTVLPADHMIKKCAKFRDVIEQSYQVAQKENYLITLGITPDSPHTGYGYLVCNECFDVGKTGRKFSHYKVDSIIEKPSLKKAKKLLATGNALWNSGMFIWRVDVILEALKEYLPELYHKLAVFENKWDEKQLAQIYPRLPAISIDYGVMEKADNVIVFPVDLGWNDLGSWGALGEIFTPDSQGNISPNGLLNLDSQGVTVYSPNKLVATVGVKDIVVVDTEDVLLLCSKERIQDVKNLVGLLEESGRQEYL